MKVKLLVAMISASLAWLSSNTCAAADHGRGQALDLSPELLGLLRAEMREITVGMQGLLASLAAADWKSIEETSEKIQDSYILEKQLTPAQVEELETALPGPFRQLDAEFHQRAGKLGAAAAAHDAELVAFHYSRLVESCSRCHSEFARQRFPGFSTPAPGEHHH
jgi:cytochrome c556